jgi:hypothetical protein
MQHIETGPIFTNKLYPLTTCRPSQTTGIFLCRVPRAKPLPAIGKVVRFPNRSVTVPTRTPAWWTVPAFRTVVDALAGDGRHAPLKRGRSLQAIVLAGQIREHVDYVIEHPDHEMWAMPFYSAA